MYNCRSKNSGIYSVLDNIEQLQFKIHFRSINTLLKLEKYKFYSKLSTQQRKANVSTAQEEEIQSDDWTTTPLKWQQKVLSPTERELYKDVKNCLTDQQRKYHDMLKENQKDIAAKERKHAKKKRQRKSMKTEENVTGAIQSSLVFTYVHDDNFKPTGETENSKPEELVEVMYVYAALEPDTQLLIIKWFKQQKLLYIYPDFNDFQNQPYFIELDTDYRHLYSYGVEDTSLKRMPLKSTADEFLYLPELSTHWRFEDELAQKFAMPPKRTHRCAILFTINDVSNFEYDNIHVRYNIKLPSATILEEGLLESSSHAAAKSNSSTSCHIGLCWQLTILCEEQFDASQNLKIYFELISIDSWERERLEGYCHYTLNLLKPHEETVKLQCLRPVETFMESLNRFFIGGRRKFDYIRFTSPVENNKENDSSSYFHSRYGIHMRNSGQLNLSCQTITQRNCELLNPCISRTSGMTLDDIMMAYKEARRRLEAIAVK